MEDGKIGFTRDTEIPGLGAAIAARREASQLTQAVLAERANSHVVSISNIERGARMPSVAALFRLADVLDVSVDALRAEAAKLHAASLRARKTGGKKNIG